MAEYIEREKLIEHLKKDPLFDLVERYGITGVIDSIPAADVVPMDFHERCLQIEIQKRMALEKADVRSVPLWTGEPISGTEFMTHNQGQSGFEIHFRTDDKAKYEAIQDECRRQIDHAKPAADVRPAVRGEWGKSINPNFSPFDDSGEYLYRCNQCRHIQNYESNFCPNCGADMREES